MDSTIVLVLLLVVGLPAILAIWLTTRAIDARRRLDELTERIAALERNAVEREPSRYAAPESAPAPASVAPEPPPVSAPKPIESPPPVAPPPPPPPVFIPPADRTEPVPEPVPVFAKSRPVVNWEQFMGVKLFAWLGGLALFLGVAFFVKYSFDNGLIPPPLRVALGFLAGLGLLVGGVAMSRKNYPALSQTLCGTGTVILYAVTFACHSIYHFSAFGLAPTFLVMALVTAAAFLLAVRLDALVVAILGILGGFLTPFLLSTGEDNPFGLFGYIAILDIGLILVALRRRWAFLTVLGAAATAVMEIGWANEFFVAGKYFDGDKIFVALGVLVGFSVLFLAAKAWATGRDPAHGWHSGAALCLAGVALAFAAWFLSFEPLAARPAVLFSFVFLIDAVIVTLVFLDHRTEPALPIAGLAVFGLLGFWTANTLNDTLLNAGLVCYFVFAVWHAVVPLVFQRRFGIKTQLWAAHVFPFLALLLVLVPIFKFAEVSFVVWPFILLVDLLAIILAALVGSLVSVLAVLVLTLAATAALIFKIPATLTGLPVSFFLLGAFAVFFVVVSVWLFRKFKPKAAGITDHLAMPDDLAGQLPIFSSVLPFLLLMMASVRLHVVNPSPIFGLALLLVVLLLGVARILSIDALLPVGLLCVTAVECAWHFSHFETPHAGEALIWYLVFYAVFTLFPFVFLRSYERRKIPWATAALAGVPQFFLLHRLITAAYPNQYMGLLPMAFAVPALLGLVVLLKKIPADNPARMTDLAWFGGVGLFFITLIFPIQFDRQWITIGWALEGAALLWLFHRVPHPGLRWAGAWLLVAAFVRLAVNPAVLEYHPRSATPILNWYLYAYGIVTVCLFAGARLLAPPRNSMGNLNVPPILYGLGAVLAFLLLNIEIADFFSERGSTLTFQFSGNFARDMTYSITWAVFALMLLVVGIMKKIPASRYAAVGLLSVTLLKLFFHDLAQLNQLYRIGALVGVAIIAMLASFAYQRFFAATLQPKDDIEPAR